MKHVVWTLQEPRTKDGFGLGVRRRTKERSANFSGKFEWWGWGAFREMIFVKLGVKMTNKEIKQTIESNRTDAPFFFFFKKKGIKKERATDCCAALIAIKK